LVGAPAAAAIAAPLPAVGPLPGDATDFSFRSFHADYDLGRDADDHATLKVVETMVALFPQSDQNHGIIRDIPASYGSADLQTDVLSVTDADGRNVDYGESDQGGFVQLQIGDASTFVHGATSYVITYTQVDTVRHFENTDDDEFYWDVNGTGWAQPFGTVSATVHVADDLVEALNNHTACYQGAANSTTPCQSGVQAVGLSGPTPVPSASGTPDHLEGLGFNSFTASATNLAAGENLTIAIGFQSGTFVDESGKPTDGDPNTLTDGQATGILLSLFGFPAVLVGTIGGWIARRKRTEPARGFIVPQYSPPPDLDVMTAAELINRSSTAVPAELVSLAVRGKTRLLGYPVTSARAADYSVQLLDSTGLVGFDSQVLTALFGDAPKPGATHDLKKYGDDQLADGLRPVVEGLPGTLDTFGAYSGRRHSVGAIVVLVITGALLLTAIAGAAVGGVDGFWTGSVSIVAGIVGVLVAVAGVAGPKKLSAKGAAWNDYLLGMKRYLTLAEADRLKVLQSPTGAERIDTTDGKVLVKLYEKLLPWAIIWGVEDQWSKVLEIELQRADLQPDFWVGQTAFSAAVFAPLLGGLGRSAMPIPTSTSGSGFSSFGGGSFGGGFSGGGGGGGGGGGW
jgi:uncharacterized membrane protein YgcG